MHNNIIIERTWRPERKYEGSLDGMAVAHPISQPPPRRRRRGILAGALLSRLPPFLTPPVLAILLTEAAERFSYFGFRAILVLYLNRALAYDEPSSVALFSYVSCAAYFTPLLGAVAADAYLGRYSTILWFGMTYFVGLVVLTAGAYLPPTAAPGPGAEDGGAGAVGADDDDDLEDAGIFAKRACTLVGLGLACLGTGGIKPCVSAFGADQVTGSGGRGRSSDIAATATAAAAAEECDGEIGGGETVRLEGGGVPYGGGDRSQGVDGAAADDTAAQTTGGQGGKDGDEDNADVRSFFSCFYFCINVGALLSIFAVPIIRGRYGFGAAFLAPTVFLCFALVVFVSKSGEYRMHQAGGGAGEDSSSLSGTFRVLLLLIRERVSRRITYAPVRSMVRPNHDAVEDSGPRQQGHSPRQLDVEDAEQLLRLVPVLSLLPIFWMLYDQQGSVWTLQATRMELHGLEPEQLNVINPVEIMLFIPLFERGIYPALESRGWNISHLRRMSAGMLLTAVSFAASGLLESAMQRGEQAGEDKLSVAWQIPQITIISIAEILVSVTGLEFAYANSPSRMKALVMAIYLLTTSAGDFLGGILYSSVFRTLNRAVTMHVCATIMLLNLVVFLRVVHWWESDSVEETSRDDAEQSSGSGQAANSCAYMSQSILRRRNATPPHLPSSRYSEVDGESTDRGSAPSNLELKILRPMT